MAVRIGSLPSEQALGGRSWRGARGRARVKHRKFGRAGQAAVRHAFVLRAWTQFHPSLARKLSLHYN